MDRDLAPADASRCTVVHRPAREVLVIFRFARGSVAPGVNAKRGCRSAEVWRAHVTAGQGPCYGRVASTKRCHRSRVPRLTLYSPPPPTHLSPLPSLQAVTTERPERPERPEPSSYIVTVPTDVTGTPPDGSTVGDVSAPPVSKKARKQESTPRMPWPNPTNPRGDAAQMPLYLCTGVGRSESPSPPRTRPACAPLIRPPALSPPNPTCSSSLFSLYI